MKIYELIFFVLAINILAVSIVSFIITIYNISKGVTRYENPPPPPKKIYYILSNDKPKPKKRRKEYRPPSPPMRTKSYQPEKDNTGKPPKKR
jgi:hypothetical protein